MKKLKIVYMSPDEIKIDPNNCRSHPEEQIQEIADGISAYGFNNPVKIDTNKMLIAGEGRLKAAFRLGLTQIPTVTLYHLNEAQRRAYALADNKIALNAKWDLDRLSAELDALSGIEEIDISTIGFTDLEIEKILKMDVGILPNIDPGDIFVKESVPHYRKKPGTKNGQKDKEVEFTVVCKFKEIAERDALVKYLKRKKIKYNV